MLGGNLTKRCSFFKASHNIKEVIFYFSGKLKKEKKNENFFSKLKNLWCMLGNAIPDTLRNYSDTCPGLRETGVYQFL